MYNSKRKKQHHRNQFKNSAPKEEMFEEKMLFVTNFKKGIRKNEILHAFKEYVPDIKVSKKRMHAFISTQTVTDTRTLLDLNGTSMEICGDKTIVIQLAKKEFKLPGDEGYQRVPLSDKEFDLEPLDPDELSIHLLCDDLIFAIFDHLSPIDIIGVEQICRRWQMLVYQYFQMNFKPKIEKTSITFWLMENKIEFDTRPLSKVLILCGESLKSLDITGHLFSKAKKILPIVAHLCPSIEQLTLNEIEQINKRDLTNLPQKCKYLKEINISYCHPLRDEHMSILFKKCKLESLSLTSVGVEGLCFADLPSSIKSINLDSIPCDSHNLSFIPLKCPNLERIWVNDIGKEFDTFDLEELSSCENLMELKLQVDIPPDIELNTFNNLTDLSLSGIIENLNNVIKSIPKIKKLDLLKIDYMSGDHVDFSGLKYLMKLSLPIQEENNEMGDDLMNSFLACSTLEYLDLGCYDKLALILDSIRDLPLLNELRCLKYFVSLPDVPKLIRASKKRFTMLNLCVKMESDVESKLEELEKANLKIPLFTPSISQYDSFDEYDDIYNSDGDDSNYFYDDDDDDNFLFAYKHNYLYGFSDDSNYCHDSDFEIDDFL